MPENGNGLIVFRVQCRLEVTNFTFVPRAEARAVPAVQYNRCLFIHLGKVFVVQVFAVLVRVGVGLCERIINGLYGYLLFSQQKEPGAVF